MALRKLIVNMDEDLIAKIDEYAAKLHINRTAAFSVIASQFIDQQNTMNAMQQLIEMTQKQDS